MVDFSLPRKRSSTEAVLPMINVVFLLLIFFLMTTRIAPQAPFPVTPPDTETEATSKAAPMMFLSSTGEMFFEGARGDAALQVIATHGPYDEPVILRADAEVAAKEVAALLTKLRAIGVTEVSLVGQNP
ncbi:biopolymer transporter ExbD [Shimia sp. CNT1-13L.2]|uniref:ExbD/TolR family protein n=1 Tax=Shimia sp. CNT1-13L.2 TaxID=2959663 RepID=UPI0020CD3D2B|nr:biopolymer transporter ExbD [Shimia sp. CNT1-13L.2]MCP9484087.1 biopolymer transporter ExbD [Shimia sp. CNT1-13L.2]